MVIQYVTRHIKLGIQLCRLVLEGKCSEMYKIFNFSKKKG